MLFNPGSAQADHLGQAQGGMALYAGLCALNHPLHQKTVGAKSGQRGVDVCNAFDRTAFGGTDSGERVVKAKQSGDATIHQPPPPRRFQRFRQDPADRTGQFEGVRNLEHRLDTWQSRHIKPPFISARHLDKEKHLIADAVGQQRAVLLRIAAQG
ncbi:hypothetical protein [Pseudorhodobacter sp.]|uniref:hypothetical protein n=1 Tax=Pseudorhodobacter sp. TaxID=1934400 RepID=UPI0026483479|nr:hypothetical protein [Pseudorhodobacter sp.]MDN5789198.1 hypothetical protein [Pseudorhodobacter sp.]